jgi:hypothetical protein
MYLGGPPQEDLDSLRYTESVQPITQSMDATLVSKTDLELECRVVPLGIVNVERMTKMKASGRGLNQGLAGRRGLAASK